MALTLIPNGDRPKKPWVERFTARSLLSRPAAHITYGRCDRLHQQRLLS